MSLKNGSIDKGLRRQKVDILMFDLISIGCHLSHVYEVDGLSVQVLDISLHVYKVET
jgi:hypothetical protein